MNGINQEVEICRMPLAQISENFSRRGAVNYQVSSLGEVKETVFKKAIESLGRSNPAFRRNGAPPADMGVYDARLSCVTMAGGQIRTMLLIRKISETQLRVVVFWSLVKDAQKELLALLQTAVSRAAKKYAPDAWLEFLCTDARMKMVVACLSSDYETYKERNEWWSEDPSFTFTPGETISYRVEDWMESPLARLPRLTIAQERNISSLELADEDQAERWKQQGTEMNAFLAHVKQCFEDGSLIPDLSLFYAEKDVVKAMLLVTGNESDEYDLIVADWYICDQTAQFQLCSLLQMLFEVAGEQILLPVDTITFVFGRPEQKRLAASVMDGVLDRDSLMLMYEHPDLVMVSARLQALADQMTQLGYGFVLEYPQGGLPSMKVMVADTQTELEFSYDTLWDGDELSGFYMYVLSEEPVADAWQADERYVVDGWEEPLELDAWTVAQRMIRVVKEVEAWMYRARNY